MQSLPIRRVTLLNSLGEELTGEHASLVSVLSMETPMLSVVVPEPLGSLLGARCTSREDRGPLTKRPEACGHMPSCPLCLPRPVLLDNHVMKDTDCWELETSTGQPSTWTDKRDPLTHGKT